MMFYFVNVRPCKCTPADATTKAALAESFSPQRTLRQGHYSCRGAALPFSSLKSILPLYCIRPNLISFSFFCRDQRLISASRFEAALLL